MSDTGTPARVGSPVGGPGQIHEAAHALRHQVVAGARRVGPVLPEAGHRAVDQARAFLAQARVVEPEFREPADLEILDQHVGSGRELAHDPLAVARSRNRARSNACRGWSRGNRPHRGGRRPCRQRTGGPSRACRRPRLVRSTLITSAPRSASIWPAHGPARMRASSSTRTPANGPGMRNPSSSSIALHGVVWPACAVLSIPPKASRSGEDAMNDTIRATAISERRSRRSVPQGAQLRRVRARHDFGRAAARALRVDEVGTDNRQFAAAAHPVPAQRRPPRIVWRLRCQRPIWRRRSRRRWLRFSPST